MRPMKAAKTEIIMKLYSRNIAIAGTVYILANDENEAQKAYDSLRHTHLTIRENDDGDLPVYGGDYHPGMPDLSLSPNMTVHGVFPNDMSGPAGFEEVEEFPDEDDGDDGEEE